MMHKFLLVTINELQMQPVTLNFKQLHHKINLDLTICLTDA